MIFRFFGQARKNAVLADNASASPSLRTRIAQFRALTPPQRHAMIQASAALPIFSLILHGLGLARMQTLLSLTGNSHQGAQLAASDIRAVSEAVAIAGRHAPFRSSCLTRSLLLCWLLKRKGMASTLRIGVRKTAGALDAHAWVEYDGIPINDQPDIELKFAAFNEALPLQMFNAR